jgi:hypothetical protein
MRRVPSWYIGRPHVAPEPSLTAVGRVVEESSAAGSTTTRSTTRRTYGCEVSPGITTKTASCVVDGNVPLRLRIHS